jgi:hypothetical protein
LRRQSGTPGLCLQGSVTFPGRGAWIGIRFCWIEFRFVPGYRCLGGGGEWRLVEFMVVTPRLRVVTFERKMSRRLRYDGDGESKEMEIWSNILPSLGKDRPLNLLLKSLNVNPEVSGSDKVPVCRTLCENREERKERRAEKRRETCTGIRIAVLGIHNSHD